MAGGIATTEFIQTVRDVGEKDPHVVTRFLSRVDHSQYVAALSYRVDRLWTDAHAVLDRVKRDALGVVAIRLTEPPDHDRPFDCRQPIERPCMAIVVRALSHVFRVGLIR